MNIENNEYIDVKYTASQWWRGILFIYSIYEFVTLKLLCKKAINPNL